MISTTHTPNFAFERLSPDNGGDIGPGASLPETRVLKSETDSSLEGTEGHDGGVDQTIKATHSFKKVTARDGNSAIQVVITRDDGEEVTCLLPDGARGKLHSELSRYGKDVLVGATLSSHTYFETMVKSLFQEIQGHKVIGGELQTDDEPLKDVFQIVLRGVRRVDGFSWAEFEQNDERIVSGVRVYDNGPLCYDSGYCDYGGFFAFPLAE